MPTSTATPTPTPTPSPTPTPTPSPGDLLAEAERHAHNGNYEAAAVACLTALRLAAPPSVKADARFCLGANLLWSGSHDEAVEALQAFLRQHPDDPRLLQARLLLAEALRGVGRPQEAAEYYRQVLREDDTLAPYLYRWMGDAYREAGDFEAAIAAYREAVRRAPRTDFLVEVRERLGLAYAALGDYASALAQYDAILAVAEQPTYRARIAYQAAQTLLIAGEEEAAYARLQRIVNSYPATRSAYQALVDLLNAGQPVDEFQRGLVDYYNDAYTPAIAAFYRYIEANPEAHSGSAHYYAGLSYRALGNYPAAVEEFQTLLDTHPENRHWGEAWLALAWTHYLAGDSQAAIESYLALADGYPDHPQAPEALWWAAKVLEWSGDYEEAAEVYTRLAADYPTDEHAGDAVFLAGLSTYRAGDIAAAQSAWQAAPPTAATTFWLGKSYLEAGHPLSATQALSRALHLDPTGYYGRRAADLLADRSPFAPLSVTLTLSPTAQVEAETWLAGWLGITSTRRLRTLPPALAADPRWQRGRALWALGHREEAKAELESLRAAYTRDPLALYPLALAFRDLGLYRSSILAADALIRLSPAATVYEAPPFLVSLAYPTPYADLVLPQAQTYHLDPLLLFAVIRQESLFEGFATSYAAARGLMQVIPSTGRYIAGQLRWPDYDDGDLYRPYVSVAFGSWYLAEQRDRFDGDLFAALAAYNAGPGNSRRWKEAAPNDPDLFVETIRFQETRRYVRAIYSHYAVYRWLYGVSP